MSLLCIRGKQLCFHKLKKNMTPKSGTETAIKKCNSFDSYARSSVENAVCDNIKTSVLHLGPYWSQNLDFRSSHININEMSVRPPAPTPHSPKSEELLSLNFKQSAEEEFLQRGLTRITMKHFGCIPPTSTENISNGLRKYQFPPLKGHNNMAAHHGNCRFHQHKKTFGEIFGLRLHKNNTQVKLASFPFL